MHSTWFSSLFLRFSKFPRIQEGDLISWREPVLQNGWIIWTTILHFNFQYLKDPNSWWFIRSQCILHDSAVIFLNLQNFLKFKRGDLISWGKPIPQNSCIILSPFLYFNLKNLKEPNSWWFIRFQCILHDSALLFSDFKNFLKFKRGNLISWREPNQQNSWIFGPPSVFQF